MHQSGHWRAQSMQTVQFSSFRAMTPRARAAGASFSCGYCTVTAGFSIVLQRHAEAFDEAGQLGSRQLRRHQNGHLERRR